MKNKTKIAPVVTPHKYTEQEFTNEYKALCEKTGFQIAFEPRWAQSRDNGDYRLVIVTFVVQMPEK